MKSLNKKPVIGITGYRGVLGSYFIKKYSKKFNFAKYKYDILDFNKLSNWYKKKKPEYFLHFAAKVPISFVEKNYQISKRSNLQGTKNLILLIKNDANLKWFFFSSSSHVYKRSEKKLNENSITEMTNKYSKTKMLAERELLKLKNKKICIGRIFSFTSKNQNKLFVIPSIFKQLKKNENKIFFDFGSKRDFIHIDDICSAINFLMFKEAKGIYNIGSGKSYKIIEIVKFFSKKLKKKILIKKKNLGKIDTLTSDISKIKKLGWYPKFKFKKILLDYYNSKK